MKKISVFVFIIYVINGLTELTVIPYLYGGGVIAAVRYLCYSWFAIKAVHDIRRIRLLTAVIGFIAFIIVICTGKMQAATLVLILFAMSDCDPDQVIKKVFFAVSAFFIITVTLSAAGILPDWHFQRDNTIRHALGFHYPTDAHSVFLSAVLMYIYSYRKRPNFFVLSAILFANCALFWFTDGRLGFILSCLAIFYALIRSVSDWKIKIPNGIFAAIPLLLCAAAVVGALFFDDGFINKLLSDRLMYAKKALESYPVTLFGSGIEWYGWGGFGHTELPQGFEYNFVDISYIRVLFDFGIIGSIVIIAGYTRLLYKQKDRDIIAVLIFVLIWAFIEPVLAVTARNVFLLLLARFTARERE